MRRERNALAEVSARLFVLVALIGLAVGFARTIPAAAMGDHTGFAGPGWLETLTSGSNFNVVIRPDGTLEGWGANTAGQLDLPAGAFTQVSAGSDRICGLRPGGSILCWGGNAPQAEYTSAAYIQVSTGPHHICALLPDGTVSCWGENTHGEASPPAGQTFSQISVGENHTCGIRSDGTLLCWGDNAAGQAAAPAGTYLQVSSGLRFTCALSTAGTLACWGDQVSPPAGLYTQVKSGGSHACALRADHTLVCWGLNTDLQATPPAGTFTQISAGELHTCGLQTNGTLACWGNSGDGRTTPPTAGPYGNRRIGAGGSFSLAIQPDGSLVGWGGNGEGELDLPGETFTQVSAGFDHACGIRMDGSLLCWGGSSTPEAHAGSFVQVSAGFHLTCAVRSDGMVECWGANYFGETEPPAVPFTQVSVGGYHGCGVTPTGALQCWGDNGYHQRDAPAGTFTQVSAGLMYNCALGTNGNVTCWGNNNLSPIQPSGVFTQVITGANSACGIRTDHTVACWDSQTGAVADSPLGDFSQLSAGQQHTCGLRTDGTLTCWGYNAEGEAPSITFAGSDLPATLLGSSYSQQLSASGGTEPYTYKLASGSMPPGINLSPSGLISGTPTGGGTFAFTIQATDSWAVIPLSAQASFTLAVQVPPVLNPVGDQSVPEGTALSFTATAADPNTDQTLTYSLDSGAPAGAAINPATGEFTWTPTEAQGPGTYPVTLRVTDNGSPAMDDSETIQIAVAEVNAAPELAAIGNQSVQEGATLSFIASATDSDIPANSFTYTLGPGAPEGAAIAAATGAFTWTPTEAQGPGGYPITVVVTDNGTPAQSDSETIQVTVGEVNIAPVLAQIGDHTVNEQTRLTFTASASDADLPANTFTYTLDAGAPAGASINSATGEFSWIPTEAQGPGIYPLTVRVNDNGSPALTDEETIRVTVVDVNSAPVLAPIGDRTVSEGSLLSFTATASDSDEPANTLTYTLDPGAPAGFTIHPSTGVITWTPTEAQGPGTYPVTIRVTDNGTPALADSETIQVTVEEVNTTPVLASIGDRTVKEGETLHFTASASDADLPANALTYTLDAGAPAGAGINAATGELTWTPTEAQGPGTYPVTVRVTDNGSPTLADSETIQITVEEVNLAPVLAAIGHQTVKEGETLRFTASGTDADLPANSLTYSLDAGAPAGAGINATTGEFTWTPSEAQGPVTYTITVRVTDNGTPALADTETIQVSVEEVNTAPQLASIGNRSVGEGTVLYLTASATDGDLPANTLTYTLDAGAPAGASINAATGELYWTPSEAQGPDTYPITIRVTDNGTPALSDSETIQVTVEEVNTAPQLSSIGNKAVKEGETLSFTAAAVDNDLPANALTYSLDAGAPAGTSINPVTGEFTWTPTPAQGPQIYSITIRVTDNGTPALSDSETILVSVGEVNTAPVLAAIEDKTVVFGRTLTFTASAVDNDIPANTLTYSLGEGAPAGASINPYTGVFTWTPVSRADLGAHTITIWVTDNGLPVLNDGETFQITVTWAVWLPLVAQ